MTSLDCKCATSGTIFLKLFFIIMLCRFFVHFYYSSFLILRLEIMKQYGIVFFYFTIFITQAKDISVRKCCSEDEVKLKLCIIKSVFLRTYLTKGVDSKIWKKLPLALLISIFSRGSFFKFLDQPLLSSTFFKKLNLG